jgi:hypothetical protein
MNRRTYLLLFWLFAPLLNLLASDADEESHALQMFLNSVSPAVERKVTAIQSNWRAVTPEILLSPDNAEAIPVLREIAKHSHDVPSRILLLNINDPEIIQLCLAGYRTERPGTRRSATGYLERSTNAKIIALIGDDLDRAESSEPKWFEDTAMLPLSVAAAGVIQGIIANSPSFQQDLKTWVKSVPLAPEESRQAMRLFWAQNKDLLVAAQYDLVRPPANNLLTALGPAQLWIGLKNSDDVGTKFDLLAEVLKNGTVIGSGQVNGVAGGSSGFNNAKLDAINLAMPGAVAINSGDTLSLRLSVRIATTGHRSGTARLWYNDAAANSRFSATIAGTTNSYFLRSGSTLTTTAGTGPKSTIDVFVDRAVGGNPFKPFGTWNKTF